MYDYCGAEYTGALVALESRLSVKSYAEDGLSSYSKLHLWAYGKEIEIKSEEHRQERQHGYSCWESGCLYGTREEAVESSRSILQAQTLGFYH